MDMRSTIGNNYEIHQTLHFFRFCGFSTVFCLVHRGAERERSRVDFSQRKMSGGEPLLDARSLAERSLKRASALLLCRGYS